MCGQQIAFDALGNEAQAVGAGALLLTARRPASQAGSSAETRAASV
jgi:hypothetical protein